MGALDTVYVVLVVLVAVAGVAAVLAGTDSPRPDGRDASLATAAAVSLFVVALGASLLL